MGDLAGGMDAGIGAPRGSDGVGAGIEVRERGFEGALHGGKPGLALPAGEGGAVIFDAEGVAGHEARG